MRNLWREASIAALVCGSLTACASPAYPTSESDAPGRTPTMAKPAYPIAESSAPAAAQRPRPPVADSDPDSSAAEPAGPPLAAPVAPVESQPLPAPGPSASALRPAAPAYNLDEQFSGGARLQYASLSTEATPATATTAAPVTSAPAATPLPPAASPPAVAPTSTASTATAPIATSPTASTSTPPATTPAAAPPPAAEPALTPQMVVHDQPSSPPAATRQPPATRQTMATRPAPIDRTLNDSPRQATGGDVVDASSDLFQNYEVQHGDHIDALARAFSTTRQVLADANHIRAPYGLRPGQIIKVPVAKAYVARGGDTLSAVARRFSVGVGELAQLNHLAERAPLRAGQEIGLPSSMRDGGPIYGAGEDARYAEASPPTYHTQPPPTHDTGSSTTSVRRYGQFPAAETPLHPTPQPGYQTSQPPAATTQVAPSISDSDIAQAAHGRFVWPVRGDMLARFGPQGVGRRNDGIDIRAAQGTVVKAAAQGEVVYAGNQVPGFGNLVLIKHSDGWVTAYAHLDTVDVQMKQHVTQGESVGSVGLTGGATEPELHFEVRYAPTPADKARPVDPVLVLPLG
jgi:murein DD-endopeptidase MepM/ murein hydrolase activator NlpD